MILHFPPNSDASNSEIYNHQLFVEMSRKIPTPNQTLPTIPRRSPRFLPSDSPKPFDPNTPKRKLEANRILHSASTPLSSTPTSNPLLSPSINSVGLKRSARLGKIKNPQEEVPNGIQSNAARVLRRVGKKVDACNIISSNSMVEMTIGKSNLGITDGKHLKRKVGSDSSKAKLGVEGKIEKRVTRSNSRTNECEDERSNCNVKFQGDTNPVLSENSARGEFTNEKTQGSMKLVVENFAREEKGKYVGREKEQIGKKRKLNQCLNKSECVKGWTVEQEQALQRAYFAARPTPQFWKRVSKMVPGKSAQDCFDKIHSAHLTPPQAQRRSKAKKITSSPLSFSASKLLNSPELKSKKSRFSRVTQKTVRQLVQKQCINGQDEGADLFAIFEATEDPSNGASQQPTSCCTPKKNNGASNFQISCHETSSADRKSLSRLNMSSGSSLISPPVLKQIKNKALHEKYIDLLHRRDTKRKAALSRAAKQVASQNNKLGTQDGKVVALSTARNALYFDASDVINQFQQSQMNAAGNCDLSDDDHLESDDGED